MSMLKYQQIAMEIEKYIEDHALQQGDKLPVLETLMAQFDVSKSTITKALELLEKKGVIFQVRGSGIFVRRLKQEAAHNLNIELDDDVYYVKRVQYINGQTLCLEESYYNKSIVTYLN